MPCSHCGKTGHNIKTCPHISEPKIVKNIIKKKKSNSKKTEEIVFEDINLFYSKSIRSKNDKSNKKREIIIDRIINDNILIEWLNNYKWFTISHAIWNYLDDNKPFDYIAIKCKLIAGRKNNDFNITYFQINNIKTIKKEFKYNSSKISDCPQWVSPMHPSRYMDKNFEEYHYINHFSNISDIYGLEKPSKEDFVNKIHYEKPECVGEYQKLYYKGAKKSSQFTNNLEDINKYKKCKEISEKSIQEFLKTANLNIEKLNSYLIKSQKDKEYMLFDTHKNKFINEKPDIKDYTIKNDSIKKTKNSFIGETESGKKISILLRWKNGNGIAFPAFQIK